MEDEKSMEITEAPIENSAAEDNSNGDDLLQPEFDDDGNMIIPDEEESEEESIQEEIPENDDAKKNESEKAPETSEEPKGETETEKALRAELEELKKRDKENTRIVEQLREVLPKLGSNNKDLVRGLIELAAEAEDKSPDEYEKTQNEEARMKKAMDLLKKTEIENMVRADLEELKKNYPELAECKTIMDIPNVKEFGRFRDLGLTAVQAYSAANPNGIRKTVAESVKRQSLNDTKEHLRSSVANSKKAQGPYISKNDLSLMRSALPDKSDKELYDLYRKVNK